MACLNSLSLMLPLMSTATMSLATWARRWPGRSSRSGWRRFRRAVVFFLPLAMEPTSFFRYQCQGRSSSSAFRAEIMLSK